TATTHENHTSGNMWITANTPWRRSNNNSPPTKAVDVLSSSKPINRGSQPMFRDQWACPPNSCPTLRLDAREQLQERKWIGQIIVGAGAQAPDNISKRIASSQYQHKRFSTAQPQFFHRIESA
ncbi:MAG TPA: hypothetical protein VNO32_14225, partial [Candidatus Acidoferrum sp.]|nr:hypothetical protein [Candidatus Acidoferrum sp.]